MTKQSRRRNRWQGWRRGYIAYSLFVCTAWEMGEGVGWV